MKKIRNNLDRYIEQLDKRWQTLPINKQHQYTLYFFVGYMLLTVAVIFKVVYDTSKSENDMVIEHIENPVLKKSKDSAMQDSISTLQKSQFYERK